MLDGYWVSPKGEVLEVGRTKTHIQAVIKNPKKFKETKESIQKEYDKYEEKMSWEGKAREVIMTRIMKRGWARIRERSSAWTVQVYKLTNKMNDVLWMWAKTIEKDVYDKFAPVNIYDISKGSRVTKSIDFNVLASGKGVSENVEENTKHFKIVKDVNELSDIDYPTEYDDTDLNESVNKYLE